MRQERGNWTRARARRRVVVVGATVGVVLAVGVGQMLGAFASGSPSRPIDRDLSKYVLFAFNTLNFKGAQTAGRGVISGGDVGANGIDSAPGDSSPIMNICANDTVTMDPGSQVNADTMRITHLCSVWDVYANALTGGSDVAPQNSGPNLFTTPILSSMPSFPSFSCNAGNPVTVTKNGSLTLPPGTYGAASFQDGSNVTLQPGTYTFCDFNMGKNASVTTAAGVVIQIEQTFSLSNGSSFGPVCAVPVYVRADGASGANDTAIQFSKNTQVAGHFLSLLGNMALGDHTDLSGQFVANNISSDKNVNVGGCPPGPGTTTTSSSTTSSSTSTSTSTSSTSTTATTATTSTSTSTTTTTSTSTTTSTIPVSTTSTTVLGETSTSAPATTTTTSSTTTTAPTTSTSTTTTTTVPESTTTSTVIAGETTTSSSTSTTAATSSTSTTTTTVPQGTSKGSTTTVAGETTIFGNTSTTGPSSVGTEGQPNGSSGTPTESLPFTGSGSGLAGFGLAALVAGAALVGASRRRRVP